MQHEIDDLTENVKQNESRMKEELQKKEEEISDLKRKQEEQKVLLEKEEQKHTEELESMKERMKKGNHICFEIIKELQNKHGDHLKQIKEQIYILSGLI